MKCPKCGKEVNRLLALSRADNKTMICDKCGTKEALDAAGLTEGSSVRKSILACVGKGSTPQERVRAKVQATDCRCICLSAVVRTAFVWHSLLWSLYRQGKSIRHSLLYNL